TLSASEAMTRKDFALIGTPLLRGAAGYAAVDIHPQRHAIDRELGAVGAVQLDARESLAHVGSGVGKAFERNAQSLPLAGGQGTQGSFDRYLRLARRTTGHRREQGALWRRVDAQCQHQQHVGIGLAAEVLAARALEGEGAGSIAGPGEAQAVFLALAVGALELHGATAADSPGRGAGAVEHRGARCVLLL